MDTLASQEGRTGQTTTLDTTRSLLHSPAQLAARAASHAGLLDGFCKYLQFFASKELGAGMSGRMSQKNTQQGREYVQDYHARH